MSDFDLPPSTPRRVVPPPAITSRPGAEPRGAPPGVVRDVGVVIVAGGQGTRTGGTELKQFRWVAGKVFFGPGSFPDPVGGPAGGTASGSVAGTVGGTVVDPVAGTMADRAAGPLADAGLEPVPAGDRRPAAAS